MNLTTILENNINADCKKNYYLHLLVQKELIHKHFPWLKCVIKDKVLIGNGVLKIAGISNQVMVTYSPFLPGRFDRIHIQNRNIVYHNDIHVYGDLSLCLYHPRFDKPLFTTVPLIKMIPWISEWCVFYEEWKKYGVWLGKEIKH